MQKEEFLTLVKNYTSLTTDEADLLAALQKDYPYSQVVHNLAARAAQDNHLDSKEHLLHVSAIYTTDRSVLKGIMTATRAERLPVKRVVEKTVVTSVVKTIEATTQSSIETTNRPSTTQVIKSPIEQTESFPESVSQSSSQSIIQSTDKSELLIKDILADLKKLKIAKSKFEESVEEFDKHAASAAKKALKKSDPSDSLIEEIKTSKKKVSPEGKTKEQIEIIENFIKAKPSIAKNKTAPPPESDDLAEKSLVYGDNIVSETLVEILLKQGKKEKAVEVLKKLIWKFPQKKAYFAARIEELKN